MKKRVFLSALKEISRVIEEWDEECYDEQISKELLFSKYLPKGEDWNAIEKYVIRIFVGKDEKEKTEKDSLGKSAQSA